MRVLNITGGRKKQRQDVEDAVKWSIKKLNLHRIRTLELNFSLKKLKTLYGQLEQLDDKRRKEMDSEVIGQRMRWKSKMYPSDIKYDDMPWEKEANRLETKYGNEYLEEIGI